MRRYGKTREVRANWPRWGTRPLEFVATSALVLLLVAGCVPPAGTGDATAPSSSAPSSSAPSSSAPSSSVTDREVTASEGVAQDSTDPASTKEPEKPQPPRTLVEVTRPSRGVIRDQITLSGDLRAENWIDITSRIAEEVVTVAVREGDIVAAGDLLIELNDRELSLTAREREQAHLEAVARQKTAEFEKSEAAQAESLRKLALEKASKEFARFEELVSTGKNRALSEEEYENKQFALNEAKLAEATARIARQRAEVAQELSAIAVQQAKLAWDRALLDLSRTRICSPIDGAVAFLETRPGEIVQAGALVSSVVNRRNLYCEVRVPQRHLPTLREGQSVVLTAETYPDRTFLGTLEVIHPNVDPDQGTVKVRISVVDADAVLRPGNYITARVDLAVHDQALLVPKRARLFEGQDSVIFVVREARAVRLVIPIGLQTADQLEVLPGSSANGAPPGLDDRDQVIVRGHTHLKPGALVEVYSEQPAASSAVEPDSPRPSPHKREEA